MSWRDTIKDQSVDGVPLVGSFRGARFIVPKSEVTVGRRVEVHEYPQRDIPWVEDLGRKGRSFSVPVFVDGRLGDYLVARDALIAALEEPGPGTLVHPWYGTMTVSLSEPAPVTESTSQGGRASFRLVFMEDGGLQFPSSATDTPQEVDEKADNVLDESQNNFGKVYDTTGQPGWSMTELADDLYTMLAELEDMVAGSVATIAGEIRAPANMATAIVGSIQRLQDIVTEPLRAISLYKKLFDAGDDVQDIQATTPVRSKQVVNTAAIQRLTRQTAVVEACRVSSQAEYKTSDKALATATLLQDSLDDLMEAVDPVSGAPINDAVYQSLSALRSAVSKDLRTRGVKLPDLNTYTPETTLPALVIAHGLYGDATRADEIIERNHISHPGFVVGGEGLEVMST